MSSSYQYVKSERKLFMFLRTTGLLKEYLSWNSSLQGLIAHMRVLPKLV